MLFARETHRTEPIPGCADTAGSRHRHSNAMLGSRNVPGLAGETITSAGNRLVHSRFHAGRKPPEPNLSKSTCVGTEDTAAEGERPPSRHECRFQEDLLLIIMTGPDSYLLTNMPPVKINTVVPSRNARHETQCRMVVNAIYIKYGVTYKCKLTEL